MLLGAQISEAWNECLEIKRHLGGHLKKGGGGAKGGGGRRKKSTGIEQKRKLSTPEFPFMKSWVGSLPRRCFSPSLSEDDVGWGKMGPRVWENDPKSEDISVCSHQESWDLSSEGDGKGHWAYPWGLTHKELLLQVCGSEAEPELPSSEGQRPPALRVSSLLIQRPCNATPALLGEIDYNY